MNKVYTIYELFLSLQGEGINAGRPAVFCRFSGCNLWSGREEDRLTSVCKFCDTDFVGTDGTFGGKYDAGNLAAQAEAMFSSTQNRLVICTGGEPALQLDSTLIEEFHKRGFTVAIETNGTRPLPQGLDWVCVSPKAGTELVVRSGDELKLVFPQEMDPATFLSLDFRHFLLQPMDGPDVQENTRRAIDYCLANPRWRLSVQTHKLLQIR